MLLLWPHSIEHLIECKKRKLNHNHTYHASPRASAVVFEVFEIFEVVSVVEAEHPQEGVHRQLQGHLWRGAYHNINSKTLY